MQIYPVIHFLNPGLVLEQVALVQRVGASGVFLISHLGDDAALMEVARQAKALHPNLPVGVNLLSKRALEAATLALAAGLDMAWSDEPVVNAAGLAGQGAQLQALLGTVGAPFEFFASVAFKYRAPEPDPVGAAAQALAAGFVPTTSGAATGRAPEEQKIRTMSGATGGRLAVASGMTPDNVAAYAPLLSHILVATGVSFDEHHFDPARLALLIDRAKGA